MFVLSIDGPRQDLEVTMVKEYGWKQLRWAAQPARVLKHCSGFLKGCLVLLL